MLTFEVFDDISVVRGTADLRDAEKPDQFLLGHDGRAGSEFAIWAGKCRWWFSIVLRNVHRSTPYHFSVEHRLQMMAIAGKEHRIA